LLSLKVLSLDGLWFTAIYTAVAAVLRKVRQLLLPSDGNDF
jgi:hypothetical protein